MRIEFDSSSLQHGAEILWLWLAIQINGWRECRFRLPVQIASWSSSPAAIAMTKPTMRMPLHMNHWKAVPSWVWTEGLGSKP